MTGLVWTALALPLAGAVVLAVLGTRLPARGAGWLASLVMLAAFVCSAIATIMLASRPHEERAVVQTAWTWLTAGSFQVGLDIWFDELTAVMLLVVTGIGFLIHVYSIGYMKGDEQERRFFAYLNLFVFSMLLLVVSGDLVLLLAGWGLVGLSSYLLIGFWHQKPSAIKAAKKAFVMNAIGDVGLALGIFLLFIELGTTAYTGVFAGAGSLDSWTATIAALLLLVGAVAKSAQLPLHTWLPDAMEGPTPVSALIHAATMVTAGVYLIARMNPLFHAAPYALETIVVIGVLGLLMAGA
ncbi:MAG: proton-conducting transporter membrane subunit, partial [Actinomycetota bacterium]